MSRIAQLWRRLRASLVAAESAERIKEEVDFHLDMATQRNAERGMSAASAHQAATQAFGDRSQFIESAHDALRYRPVEDSLQDLRIGWRGMRRRPGVTAAIVITLALGIAGTTTSFSLVEQVMLRPLPYQRADRLVVLRQHIKERGTNLAVSPAEYFDYLDELKSFSSFGVYQFLDVDVGGSDRPEHLVITAASSGALDALGVAPGLGRTITLSDDVAGANPVALISAALWHRRFGGQPDVLGKPVVIDGRSFTVIGVLREDFQLPEEMSAEEHVDVVIPIALDRAAVRIRGSHYLTMIGRLHDGVSLRQADAEVATTAAAFTSRFPGDYPATQGFSATLVDLRDDIVGPVRSTLWLLLAATGALLLTACVNAASLLLSIAEARQREMAVRRAIGAGTSRLIRQLAAESLLLATSACALGIALASVSVGLLASWRPFDLPRIAELSLGWPVITFALGVTLLSALSFGLLPAWRVSHGDLQSALRGVGRGSTSGRRERRGARALIIVEIAIACVMLVGASMLTLSYRRLLAVDPGFKVENVITAPLTIGSAVYPDDAAVTAFIERLDMGVRTIPGVVHAGAVAAVPLAASRGDIGIELEGEPAREGQPRKRADWQVVTPGYFEAIGMRVQRGRTISAADHQGAPGAVVINAAMAAAYWPGNDPVGRRFKLGGGAKPDTVTVVGVVENVHQSALAEAPEPEMYLAHPQFRFWGGGGMLHALTLVVRTTKDPEAMIPQLRQTVAQIAPTVPLGAMRTMVEIRQRSVALEQFLMNLLIAVSAVAILVAIVGLYALVAHSVARRTKEFGVRIALGARARDLVLMVSREGVVVAVLGLTIGVPASLAFTQLLRQFLYSVEASKPFLVAAVAITLALAAGGAAYLSASRASRVDAMVALRSD